MRILDFYMDMTKIYLNLGREEADYSFYIQIDAQDILIPAQKNQETQHYEIKLFDLGKAVQTKGNFPIFVRCKDRLTKLEFTELLESRVCCRYFSTKNPNKKVYIDTDGTLNFVFSSAEKLAKERQETGCIYAQDAKIFVETVKVGEMSLEEYIVQNGELEEKESYDLTSDLDLGVYEDELRFEITFVNEFNADIHNVSVVDYHTQKRYSLKYEIVDDVLKIDLSKIPQSGQYHIVIDTKIDNIVESKVIKIENTGVNVDTDSSPWRLIIKDDRLSLYSVRRNISHARKEIMVKSIHHKFGNEVEIKINPEDLKVANVMTRHSRLNKDIPLDYEYADGNLKINFSELDGFSAGEFWIYVVDEQGDLYQLIDDRHEKLGFSEPNRHIFLKGTLDTARYIRFVDGGYLRYRINPVSTYQALSDKIARFYSVVAMNGYFQIQLRELLDVQDVISGDNECLDFFQNEKILFVKIPDKGVLTAVKYLSVISRNQVYKLQADSLRSSVSIKSEITLFTGYHEQLAIKPITTDYFATAHKITKKIEVEIPNMKSENLEMILASGVEIREVIAINRKTLEVVGLSFEQKGQVLVVKKKDAEPFVLDKVLNYILDIVFVVDDEMVVPLVKGHKNISNVNKSQNWQISGLYSEMLCRYYITVSGGLAITVKDNYYAENWEKFKVKDDVILYEAFLSKKITDSCYAIFKYLVDTPGFEHFEHIWVIDDESSPAPEALEEKYRRICKLVVRGTRSYSKALHEAKYLFNTNSFPNYFAKKPDQVYVNTWHGTALKTLGIDMSTEAIVNSRNTIRNFAMSDYIISPNPHMTDVFADSWQLKGNYQGIILEGGYPRNDVILLGNKATVVKKLQNFSLKYDEMMPTIMYAPTWRGTDGMNPTDELQDLKEFVVKLQNDYGATHNIIMKVHYLVFDLLHQDSNLQDTSLLELLLPDHLDTNEVLQVVDILITDFSSIFFDYLLTDKPVVFYIPDKEEYMVERGLYLDLKDLPGPQVTDYDQLKKELKLIIAGKKNKYLSKYLAMKNKYLSYDDGKTTERYVKRIFKNEKSTLIKEVTVDSNKKKLLMYIGGMENNGITTAALNLLNYLDYDKYDVTVMPYPTKDEECLNNIKKLHKKARIRFSFGTPLYNSEEVLIDEKVLYSDFSKKEWENLKTGYRKNNSYRIFPNMSFDTVIDYSGYYKTVNLFSIPAEKHIIYMHNEMVKELGKIVDGRFTHSGLSLVLRLYLYADKLVNGSEILMNESKKQLSHIVEVDNSKITFARNVIDYKKILHQASENIDLNGLKSIYGNPVRIDTTTGLNFVTMGRLSPEKNQLELIKAFAKFEKEFPGARLFILGEGPLQTLINNEITKTKMRGKIVMLGHLENASAFIKELDYFVFPSLHEGQPMSLLQALVLGKKIMASNIKPNIGVLGNNEYGLIANGTAAEELYLGLKNLVSYQSEFKNFDYVKYNQEAIDDFNSLLE